MRLRLCNIMKRENGKWTHGVLTTFRSRTGGRRAARVISFAPTSAGARLRLERAPQRRERRRRLGIHWGARCSTTNATEQVWVLTPADLSITAGSPLGTRHHPSWGPLVLSLRDALDPTGWPVRWPSTCHSRTTSTFLSCSTVLSEGGRGRAANAGFLSIARGARSPGSRCRGVRQDCTPADHMEGKGYFTSASVSAQTGAWAGFPETPSTTQSPAERPWPRAPTRSGSEPRGCCAGLSRQAELSQGRGEAVSLSVSQTGVPPRGPGIRFLQDHGLLRAGLTCEGLSTGACHRRWFSLGDSSAAWGLSAHVLRGSGRHLTAEHQTPAPRP